MNIRDASIPLVQTMLANSLMDADLLSWLDGQRCNLDWGPWGTKNSGSINRSSDGWQLHGWHEGEYRLYDTYSTLREALSAAIELQNGERNWE